MEQKLRVLQDVEIIDEEANSELHGVFSRLVYSYQACGGGGCGCGGGCGRHTKVQYKNKLINDTSFVYSCKL